MSNTNRVDTKPPNIKLARYLQRIEQLVGTRGRTPSPISQRANKIVKPNTLDHYVKYQLTIKLICGVQTKKNNFYMRYFFNTLKQNYKNNISFHNSQRKVETIYKFVPIQKAECPHVMIDTGISIRILGNILKLKIKDHLKYGIDAIRATNLIQNQLLTGRSGNQKSKNSLIKSRVIDKQKNILKLQKVLDKKIKNRSSFGFTKLSNLKSEEEREKKLLIEKQEEQKRQKQREEEVEKFKQRQEILTSKINNMKIQLLIKMLKKFSQHRIAKCFNKIQAFSQYQKLQQKNKQILKLKDQQINSIIEQKQKQKLRSLSILLFSVNSKKIILQISRAAQSIKGIKEGERRNQPEIQDLKRLVQVVKQNQKVSEQAQTKINNQLMEKTYEFTNKINLSLISVISRFKNEFFNKIQMSNQIKKQEAKLKLQKAVSHVNHIRNKDISKAWNKILFLSKMKRKQQQKKVAVQEAKKLKSWPQIGTILRLEHFFGVKQTLETGFAKIKNYENTADQVNQERQNQFTFESGQQQRGHLRNNLGNMKTNIKPPQQFLILPRIIQKLYLLKSVQTFIKIKFYQKSRQPQQSKVCKKKSARKQVDKLEISYQNLQNKADRKVQSPISPINALRQQSQRSLNNEWFSDIKSFISEREHFNLYIQQNYQKLDKMLQSKESNNSTSGMSVSNSGVFHANSKNLQTKLPSRR